jgi:membrane-associated protein
VAHALDLTPDLDTLTAATVYLVVFGFVFVESGILVGFFLPGDSILFGAGLVAATAGSGVAIGVLVGGVLVAAVAGDAVGYASGRQLGRPWLVRRQRFVRHVERAERFYARYGALAVVVARWIPWVRTVTPIVAGVARMPYPRFLAANVAGAVSWGAGLVLLGYYAYEIEWLRMAAYVTAGFFITASLVYGVAGWLRERRADRARGSG